MAALLPLWVASGAVAGTVGLPVTASVGVVGILAALSSKSQKHIQVLSFTNSYPITTRRPRDMLTASYGYIARCTRLRTHPWPVTTSSGLTRVQLKLTEGLNVSTVG